MHTEPIDEPGNESNDVSLPAAILLDIDGCLNPFGFKFNPTRCIPGYETHHLAGYKVRLNPNIGRALLAVAEEHGAQITWATTWNEKADELVAPIVGLPRDLPIVRIPTVWTGRERGTLKLPTIVEWDRTSDGRRLVWIEDDIGSDARAWAKERGGVLIIQPSPNWGITQKHLARIAEFLAAEDL